MTDVDRGARYTAFLSYSHKDAAVARWLHRKLETYRIPSRLVGTEGEHGEVPARLTPIFRDRDELPAAGDLSEKVRTALAASDNLIVICSPDSAGSPWVAKEIAEFRELHPDKPVFAAIVEGEPDQCFPQGLASDTIEPLAADLRPGRDGRRLGLLKLIAGVAGVGLDALIQRDAIRRVRQVTYVTVVAVAAMFVMALLTISALNARTEAQRQRAKSESLIEFMLTDLRRELKGVGRLDVMSAVNERALAHYRAQDLDTLSARSLVQRSRILHAMGEDYLTRNSPREAVEALREAHRTTALLLESSPDHPERIFAHAQSEFWLGRVAYDQNDRRAAKRRFYLYKMLADRLVAIDPANPDWLKEAGYADGVLCSLAMSQPIDRDAALRDCSNALRQFERVVAQRKADPSLLIDLANRHGWMVDALEANGRWDLALNHRKLHEDIVKGLIESDRRNKDYLEIWMKSQLGFGRTLARRGEKHRAIFYLRGAATTADLLIRLDDKNADWARSKSEIDKALTNL